MIAFKPIPNISRLPVVHLSNTRRSRASYVNQSLTSCPNVPVVMSGWSQGAQVVHKAADLVGPEIMRSVSSVVTFGDPGAFSEQVSLRN